MAAVRIPAGCVPSGKTAPALARAIAQGLSKGTTQATRLVPAELQLRHYTPPGRRTWSKQHYRIRTPRPMVDRLDLSIELPQKEWWRERRITPATFFGFPDVGKASLRGGSLYVEQMDTVTLAVLLDRCLKQQVLDPEMWTKFSWRAQQLAARTHEPDLCYIFRAFSRADWFDQNLLTTYLGRLQRRLFMFQLPDVAVLLEAFANPRYRQSNYLQKALTHLTLLLQHRDDAKAEDLARSCAALRQLQPLDPALHRDVLASLELLAEALLLRDLGELGTARAVRVLDCYVAWGMIDGEVVSAGANASTDLCWALLREMRGGLRALGHEKPEELSVLALALATGGLQHEKLWSELVHELEHEAHRLSGSSAAAAIYACARGGPRSVRLAEAVARRLTERQADLSPLDCARAVLGFFRGSHAVIAEKAVCSGPVFERILDLGLDTFDGEALSVLLDALARAPPEMPGVEAIAGAALEIAHGSRESMTARQLASVTRSLTYLRPSTPRVLSELLDAAQAAAAAAGTQDTGAATMHPRHVAMLLQAIASQPPSMVPDADARLEACLPQVSAALAAQPRTVTASQLLCSLIRCPSSAARDAALDDCVLRLERRAGDLSAPGLVQLSEALAAFAASGGVAWKPPPSMLRKVAFHLDIKRYDLGPGILWRAAAALEAAGAPDIQLRLEERDVKP